MTAVAWLAARRLLARPVELVAKLRDFDAATIPPQTLFVLKEYIAHENWPITEIIVHEGASLMGSGKSRRHTMSPTTRAARR